ADLHRKLRHVSAKHLRCRRALLSRLRLRLSLSGRGRRGALESRELSGVELAVFSEVAVRNCSFNQRSSGPAIGYRAKLIDWSHRSLPRLIVHVLTAAAHDRSDAQRGKQDCGQLRAIDSI